MLLPVKKRIAVTLALLSLASLVGACSERLVTSSPATVLLTPTPPAYRCSMSVVETTTLVSGRPRCDFNFTDECGGQAWLVITAADGSDHSFLVSSSLLPSGLVETYYLPTKTTFSYQLVVTQNGATVGQSKLQWFTTP